MPSRRPRTGRTAGAFENSVAVSSADGDRDVADNHDLAGVRVASARTKLSLRKSVDRKTVRAGRTVWFTITARNVGDEAAANVRVCDSPSFNTTFVSAKGARFSDGRPCWTIPMLEPGARVSYRVKVRVSGTTRKSARTKATVTASNAPSRRATKAVLVVARDVAARPGVTG